MKKVVGVFNKAGSDNNIFVKNWEDYEKNAHFFFAKGGYQCEFLLEGWEFNLTGLEVEEVERVRLVFRKNRYPIVRAHLDTYEFYELRFI